VNQGQTQQVLQILQQQKTAVFDWINNADIQQLKSRVVAGFRHGLEATNPIDALKRMQEFRVLCAHRHGSHGVYTLNKHIEIWLQEAGLIQLSRPWYQGRPILITQNHYGSRLFNGELGVIWTDAETGRRMAWFENTGDKRALRRILPTRLPPHETAFAMTIHKSQGSEFNTIALVLPETHSLVLNRALLYTGLTRARQGFSLLGNQAVIEACINKQIKRHSGLGDKLWQDSPVNVSEAQTKTGITTFL
jgi:exodeoxyribonuclease V alpha subunit